MKSNEKTPAVSALSDETLRELARQDIQTGRCHCGGRTCESCQTVRKTISELSCNDDLKKRKFALEILLKEAGLIAATPTLEELNEEAAVSGEGGEESPYVVAARERYANGSDNDIEIDSDAQISEGNGGAFVQGWVWVPDEDLAAA